MEYDEQINGDLDYPEPGETLLHESGKTPEQFFADADADLAAEIERDAEKESGWNETWTGPYWNIPEWTAYQYLHFWRWRRRFVTNDIKMGEAPPLSDLAAWKTYLPSWTQTFIDPGHHDYSIGGETKTLQHNFTLLDLSQSHESPY